MDEFFSCLPDFYSWHASTEGNQLLQTSISHRYYSSVTPQSKIGTRRKKGGNLLISSRLHLGNWWCFSNHFNLILSWQEQAEMVVRLFIFGLLNLYTIFFCIMLHICCFNCIAMLLFFWVVGLHRMNLLLMLMNFLVKKLKGEERMKLYFVLFRVNLT